MTPESTPQPAPTPISDSAERVCDVLLALETAPAVGFRLVALTLHDADGVRAVVALRLGERSFNLSPDEARLLARCIGFEDERRATGLLVSLFQSAAADAEAMAARRRRGEPSAILAASLADVSGDAA